MPNTTNFNFPTPADSDLVKDGALAIRSLGNSIDTAFVDLKGGTTGQVLAKATNTDLDFQWVAQDDSNAIQNAIIDAKGDLIVGTAADTPARLASSANNGDLLTVDTSTASGLKWATPASGGGLTLISETVASALSSLSFSSLGSYKQLLLVWSGIKHSTSSTTFGIRLNNDSGSNYIGQNLWYGGGFDVATFTNTVLNNAGMAAFGVNCTGGGADSANGWLMIDNYTSTSKYKTYQLFNLFRSNGDSAGVARGGFTIGYYNSTSAITSIDVVRTAGSATFTNDTNTTIRLYGVS